jgi:hypothetical protein
MDSSLPPSARDAGGSPLADQSNVAKKEKRKTFFGFPVKDVSAQGPFG